MKKCCPFYTFLQHQIHFFFVCTIPILPRLKVYISRSFSLIPHHQQHQATKQRSQPAPTSEPDNNNNDNMAQLPPDDIATMPAHKVVFNAPFDNRATYYMRIVNSGAKRIGYAFKTTKPNRISMTPPNGVLSPKESVNVAISCDAFDPSAEDTRSDRVTVEWCNTPDPAAKGRSPAVWSASTTAAAAFKLVWFEGDGMVRRKNLPIEYNV